MANGVAWQEDEWNIYIYKEDALRMIGSLLSSAAPISSHRLAPAGARPNSPDPKSLARARVWKAKLAF
jgi:hypothetical protein